jgi:hypothetical protein
MNYRDRILKSTRVPNFMRNRPVEAQLFHADGGTDGQTDMTTLTFAFRIFANVRKNGNTHSRKKSLCPHVVTDKHDRWNTLLPKIIRRYEPVQR